MINRCFHSPHICIRMEYKMHGTIENEELGYNEKFESSRNDLGLHEFSIARVIAQHKGLYRVKNSTSEYTAKITGKDIFNAASREDYPAVGDWVAIEEQDDEQAIIRSMLPRQSVIKRKSIHKNEAQVIGANIDTAFIVESIGRDFNINRLERYHALASDGGVASIIIINKIDLRSADELALLLTQLKERFGGTEVILTSTKTDTGLDELRRHILRGKTCCFLGSSGVGKSSLVNKLTKENIAETGAVSMRADRGKHTTTGREMYFLKNGGIVIDNPGMREVGVTSLDNGITDTFDDILELALLCKFSNCSHVTEPGCSVLSAVNSGALDKERYLNYLGLRNESGQFKKTVEMRSRTAVDPRRSASKTGVRRKK